MYKPKQRSKEREQAVIRQRRHRAKLDEQIRKLWRIFQRQVWKQQKTGAVYLPGETIFDGEFYSELINNHFAHSTISDVTAAVWWDISPDLVLADSLFSIRISLLEPIPEETQTEFKEMPLDPSGIRFWFLLCVKERATFMFIGLDETTVLLLSILLISPNVQYLRMDARNLLTTKELNKAQLQPVVDQITNARCELFRQKIAERLGPGLQIILPEWQRHGLKIVLPAGDSKRKNFNMREALAVFL